MPTCARCDQPRAKRKTMCPACHAAWARDYRAANPDHLEMARQARLRRFERDPIGEERRERDKRLRSMYQIGIEDYDRMFQEQDGRCGICKKPDARRRLAVDHDHSCCPGSRCCGKCIRGLLCTSCNPKYEFTVTYRDEIEAWGRRVSTGVASAVRSC